MPKLDLGNLLERVGRYIRNQQENLRHPGKFEEERQKMKAWFASYGIDLIMDDER